MYCPNILPQCIWFKFQRHFVFFVNKTYKKCDDIHMMIKTVSPHYAPHARAEMDDDFDIVPASDTGSDSDASQPAAAPQPPAPALHQQHQHQQPVAAPLENLLAVLQDEVHFLHQEQFQQQHFLQEQQNDLQLLQQRVQQVMEKQGQLDLKMQWLQMQRLLMLQMKYTWLAFAAAAGLCVAASLSRN